VWAALALPAGASAEPAAAVPQSALHACAVIAAASERLNCYDQLAGRASPSPAAATPPAAGARSASGAAPPGIAAAAAPAVAVAAAAPASTAAAAPPPGDSFGLYAVEHPAAPLAQSLQARVISVGVRASGRMTVELERGELWELEDADPLLAAGDTVSIRRASLGSFLMETPSRRTHRVRRLR
jgi:hypothetical protein